MLKVLRIYYAAVLVTMLLVTISAQSRENLFAIPEIVRNDPWFGATLWDCYFGFFSFYFWIFYRERAFLSRLIWLIAILFLGNIAMSVYALKALFALKEGDGVEQFLLGR